VPGLVLWFIPREIAGTLPTATWISDRIERHFVPNFSQPKFAVPARTKKTGSAVFMVVVTIVSTLLAMLACEGLLRLKNLSMKNYDIEMWRYARELKTPSEDPLIGHDHIPSREAVLQSVQIRINEHGLRGGALPPPGTHKRRVLFLGSSVTLGWGVPEANTLTSVLEAKFKASGQDVEVLNGGIGNYNSVRYVERFLTELTDLKPTDIVVHYFIRDADILPPPGGNFLLRHSELAVTTWIAMTRVFDERGIKSLEDHYNDTYKLSSPGFRQMRDALARLADWATQNHVRIYLAMTPDVHDLVKYPFEPIHETMRELAQQLGYKYIDLLPALRNLTPQELWSMPGDPHPNAYGHKLMAEAIFPALNNPPAAAEPSR
jgi:lysophospholipase L1-like esterase